MTSPYPDSTTLVFVDLAVSVDDGSGYAIGMLTEFAVGVTTSNGVSGQWYVTFTRDTPYDEQRVRGRDLCVLLRTRAHEDVAAFRLSQPLELQQDGATTRIIYASLLPQPVSA